ncbi:carboxymuconolactone decarboxylase family protein [Glycomyces salinus]|uniref:carboxymuconolactone decarboxylase family protein n=1 Tax=Glycomyces salinus TaxID=980294 RepID=UPI0018EC581B|nr:carboxymuconolactone decarboxylase family protein [Glycomyces salinus]
MSDSPRLIDPASHAPAINEIAAALAKVNADGAIPGTTVSLVRLRIGQLLGSTYFTARARKEADDTAERLDAVATWREAPYFTDAERAALALTEAVHTPNPTGERVPDELFDEAAKHYSPREIVALTTVMGQIGFFIPLALIGRPKPGVSFAEQWRE